MDLVNIETPLWILLISKVTNFECNFGDKLGETNLIRGTACMRGRIWIFFLFAKEKEKEDNLNQNIDKTSPILFFRLHWFVSGLCRDYFFKFILNLFFTLCFIKKISCKLHNLNTVIKS